MPWSNAGTLTLHMTRAALIAHALRGHGLWTCGATGNGSTGGDCDWLGAPVGATARSGLCLAYADAEAALLERRAAIRRAVGAPIELVGVARARAVEPGLGAAPKLAAFCPLDGNVTAYRTASGLRLALAAAGVRVHDWTLIAGIDQRRGDFVAHGPAGTVAGRRLVLAGGVWLEQMVGWLELAASIKVLVNQPAVIAKRPPVMREVLTIASGLLSRKSFAGGGLEAETADALPIFGPVPGVAGACVIGRVHCGYTSGPAMGDIMASLVLGEAAVLPRFPLERLLARRSPRPESSR